MLRARFENQNSSPLWNSNEAKIATSTVGTAAMTENKATSRVCSRPLPSPPAAARSIASLRENSTISAIAGMRLATSSSAISGGDSRVPGSAPHRHESHNQDRDRHRSYLERCEDQIQRRPEEITGKDEQWGNEQRNLQAGPNRDTIG